MPQKPSIYVTWLFAMTVEPETAQFGLHFSVPSGAFDPLDTFEAMTSGNLDALDTAWTTLMTTPQINYADWCRYIGLKVAALDEEGHYLAEPLLKMRNPAVAGTRSGVLPQQTLCVTTMGATSFGKGTRGRFYIPWCKPNSDSSGTPRIAPGLIGPYASACAKFITDCNVAFNMTGSPQPKASIVYRQPPTASPFNATEITQIRVGDLLDTQRRRRAQISEAYSAAGLPAP